jgi:hypothetical protein
MSFGKIVTLSTGAPLPQIGLGTWLSKPNEVENAVRIVPCSFYASRLSLHGHFRWKSPSATAIGTSILPASTRIRTKLAVP